MRTALIVAKAFGDFPKGARIVDEELVKKIQASHQSAYVVVIQIPDESRFDKR